MIHKPDVTSLRALDWLLHAAGVLGLSLVAWAALALARDPVPDSDSAPPVASPAVATRLHTAHAELAELDAQLKLADQRAQERSRRIPSEACESEVLRELVQIAKQAGLTLRDYQTAAPVSRSGCQQMPVHLSGSGDYRSICRFLEGVSRIPRLTTVEKLEITTATTAAPYSVSMTVAVYFTGKTGTGSAGSQVKTNRGDAPHA